MTDATEHRWAAAEKDADETKPVELRCQRLCKAFWIEDEQYDLDEFAWPTTPTGFVLKCTTPGRSAGKEPRTRGMVAGDTVLDGSVVWQVVAPTITDGIQPITAADFEAPAGINVLGCVVSENTKLLVDYSGGTAGTSYDVKFMVTVAGRVRIGRQTVTIVER